MIFFRKLFFDIPIKDVGNVLIVRFGFLCEEAERILNTPNAGGLSIRSEALAMELLHRELGAEGVRTEMEIEYPSTHWKKCDFITKINGSNVGISVTRAIPHRNHDRADDNLYVANLLYRKLSGLIISRVGVDDDSGFVRSILFIWSPDRQITNLLYMTFEQCTDDLLKDDVELFIVESDIHTLRMDFRNSLSHTVMIV